ncbi:MAG: 5'-nucleotidase, lipoprotein e(P4) family [Planctomycetota bacterium]
MKPLLLLALAAHLALTGCNAGPTPSKSHDAMLAIAWTQHSAEFQALCATVYAGASRHLDAALADDTWTALLEQGGAEFRALPPALVIDLDETVLDNSAHAARLIVDDRAFVEDGNWRTWVEEAAAPAYPGAIEFLQSAAGKGVRVFYVTNRRANVETATIANLQRLGAPLPSGEEADVVLSRGDLGDDSSDKGTRRTWIGRSYRVLMLIGDDLGDFLSAVKPTLRPGQASPTAIRTEARTLLETRATRVRDFASHWGTRWFMLPNPTYGSWQSLVDATAMHDDGTIDRRAVLRTQRSSTPAR